MSAGHAVVDAETAGVRGAVTLGALHVRNFRNLERVDLELPPDGVAIVGDNGHGKTNLLEAMAYFSILRSIRGVRDRDLIRFGERTFSLSAEAEGGGLGGNDATGGGMGRGGGGPSSGSGGSGPFRITIGFEAGQATRKHVTIDGVRIQRLSDAFGAIPSVSIAPSDVALVAGAPGERRRYLDVLLAMTDRRYLAALQQYRAALVRRNATLRRAAVRGEAEIAIWDSALADSGAAIRAARVRWLARYAGPITDACAAMGERTRVALRYAARPELDGDPTSEAWLREQLRNALEHDRTRDMRRQLTHAGPHRDDIAVSLGGHPLRTVGSAGQQRTVAIALRLAARTTLSDASGRLPLMLLDDPFAELDAGRTARIMHLLRDGAGSALGQFVIAIPRAGELPAAMSQLRRLTIRDGRVSG